jgi:hypothetical protein
MSGYFGALMRASGMPIAGRTPALAHVESPVVEIDVERGPAPMPARMVSTPSTPQQPVTPIRVPAAVAPLTPTQLAGDTHEAQTGPVRTEHAGSRATEDTEAAVPAPRTVEPSKPPLGEALVRAAMQWVATDTQHLRGIAQAEPSSAQTPAARGDELSVAATPALREPRVDSQPHPQDEAPAPFPVPELTAHEPVATPALAATRSTRPAPAMPVAPPDHDEVIEVSIGAIHVRVDAPVAHTIARPAATPPAAARRTPTTTSQRSALSRRALRRI